ncbi:MAG: hypothetical protein E7165_01815 [Firmicutes bacterium]|nr:hypothetical protein [Bacillota bacterium]
MKFIKNHKVVISLIVIYVIVFGIIGFCFTKVFLSSNGGNKYGNRLNGIENVQITDLRFNSVKEKILGNKNTNDTYFGLTGRIIKIFIEVKSETDELTVQSLLNLILDNFTEEEKKFYDFEVFVTSEKDEELYPMIAYKHCNNSSFTTTKKVGKENEK